MSLYPLTTKTTGTFLLGCFVLLFSNTASAGIFDMNVVYSSDTIKTASEVKTAVTAYDFSLGIPIGKTGVFAGVNYGSVSSSVNTGTEQTWAGTDMGLKFSGFFGKGRLFSSGFAYNLKSTVKYNDGSSEVELRGTSMKLDFGVHYWFSEDASLALKLFYYAPSLSESVATTTLTTVSYNRAQIGEGIGLSWVF